MNYSFLSQSEQSVQGTPVVAVPSKGTDQKRILVLEDSDIFADILLEVLHEEGYHTQRAVNGLEGIKQVYQFLPHLIITDVEMPLFKGYQATRFLKSRRYTRPIPIIMFTSLSETKDRFWASQAGVDCYIEKSPEHFGQLKEEIRKLLDQAEPVDYKSIEREARRINNDSLIEMVNNLLDTNLFQMTIIGRLVDLANKLESLEEIITGFFDLLTYICETGMISILIKGHHDTFLVYTCNPQGYASSVLEGFIDRSHKDFHEVFPNFVPQDQREQHLDQGGANQKPVVSYLSRTLAVGGERFATVHITNSIKDYFSPVINENLDIFLSAAAPIIANALRTEELEVQTKLAEAASQAKSQFLASMSHEIRTPMNAIIGMSDLMRTDNLDNVQQGYFSDIKKMAKALLQIINDILDFSKIEAGKMELFPMHYHLLSLFDNICSMSTFTAMAKELEFRHSYDPRLPEALYGDEVRVRQVVTNIVNNAIKYTRRGYVHLRAERVNRKEAEWVAFIVDDSGIGIKKEDLPKLFGKFQQFDSRKNRGIVGTGLGLSITKNFVEMMGGEIEVDSEYEKGSSFRVYLPLVEGDPSQIEHTGSVGRVIAKENVRVLVVDDNSINLTVALGFLATHKIAADTALSGRLAIQMIQEKQYDLVFMDHMMPEMDGIEATAHIRALPGVLYKNIPIIALSANAVSGARESFLEGGMNDFISKPIDAEQLNLMLLKWLPKEKIAGTEKPGAAPEASAQGEAEQSPGLWEELKGIQGLDIKTGLSHVGNDENTYITILRQFCKEFEGYIDEILRFRAQENWKEYAIRVHGIKGILANMGMETLSKWAYKLELASKSADVEVCRTETEGLCEALYQFWEVLRKTSVMDEGEAVERTEIDQAALLEKLDRLAGACKIGASDEADSLAAELDTLCNNAVDDGALKELSDLVASLDYDIVVEKITELRSALG
ncbi:MAG: response regulator [Spirochaetaceae bacterium]|jgi:signal transduction histidine kinase/CheY-like chemotaxis protein|nr:response regulator [Spirochaetaceae bacterium]